jgi:hypothetical protein
MKILTLTERKPIIYPPGIISLVLLPVFCLIYLQQHKAFVHYGVVDVAFYSPDMFLKHPFKVPPQRNYLNINLNGNDADDKTRLDFARLEIRRILSTKDSTGGVDFYFGDKSRYRTLVSAFDICITENASIFIPYKSHIYVLYNKPKVQFSTGSRLGNDVIFNLLKPIWSDKVANELASFWAPAIVFILMLFFSFKKLYLNLYRP